VREKKVWRSRLTASGFFARVRGGTTGTVNGTVVSLVGPKAK